MKNACYYILLSPLAVHSISGFSSLRTRRQSRLSATQRNTSASGGNYDHGSNDRNDRMHVINIFANVASAILAVPQSAILPFGPAMMEPPATSEQERQHRAQVAKLLHVGYNRGCATSTVRKRTNDDDDDDDENYYSVYRLPPHEKASFSKYLLDLGPNPSTYGEITTLGARQLFYHMGMTQRNARKNEQQHTKDMVFCDLGMGQGKLVLQALLELPLSLKKSIGVELSHARYQCALEAWQNILQEYPSLEESSSSRLVLQQGDLFEQDLVLVTHIYVASLCFTDEMMRALNYKLIEADTPNLKCVATLKELPLWKFSRREFIEMTWTKPFGSQVFFYDL